MDSKQIEAVANWFIHNIIQISVIVSAIIQITPIKLNPWTRLFKWIGKLITADSDKKIDGLVTSTSNLETDISELRSKVDENEKDRIRWEVLDFANSCRNGRRHTKDEF